MLAGIICTCNVVLSSSGSCYSSALCQCQWPPPDCTPTLTTRGRSGQFDWSKRLACTCTCSISYLSHVYRTFEVLILSINLAICNTVTSCIIHLEIGRVGVSPPSFTAGKHLYVMYVLRVYVPLHVLHIQPPVPHVLHTNTRPPHKSSRPYSV